MTTPILARFEPSPDPADPSGWATYTYAGRTERVLMGSRAHADRAESFMQHLLYHARQQARKAGVAHLRGAANALEADTEPPK